MAVKTKDKAKKEEQPLDVEALDSRRLNPRIEGVKGFLENFSTFAAFGLVGGAAIAAITIGALVISSGGGIAAVPLAKSIAIGITFASSAISGLVGGTHYAAHRMHHAERVNDMLDDAKDLLKRKQARGVGRDVRVDERDRDRDADREPIRRRDYYERDNDAPAHRHAMEEYRPSEEREARPQWLEESLKRRATSAKDRILAERSSEQAHDGHRFH